MPGDAGPPAAICLSAKRLSLPVSVFGSCATYSIARGYLYGRNGLLDVILQRLRQRGVALGATRQNHIGLDDHAARLVGRADHAAFGDGRMRQQRRFDLGPAML
jgi:hypothetical protein